MIKHTILFVYGNNKVAAVYVRNGDDNLVTKFDDIYVIIKAGHVLLCDVNRNDASDYFVSDLKDTTIIYRED